MSTNANTQTIADRITSVAGLRGLSVNALMAAAGVSKSVVDRLKAGTMPAADKIAAIAGALSVPTDFILGVGVFAKWDLLCQHKKAVLANISGMMKNLSGDIENGVDDLSFIFLVEAFGVDIEEGDNPSGLEILITSPIATNPAPVQPTASIGNNALFSQSKRDLMNYYDRLPQEDREIILAEARALFLKAQKGSEKGTSASSAVWVG